MAWTHVVPSLVMAVTLTGSYPLALRSWRDLIRSGQPIKRPFATSKFPFIHEKDLAEIIARALPNPTFDGKKVHASGKRISDLERVETLREVLRREIVLEQLSPQQARMFYREQGMSEHDSDYVLETSAWFAENTQETYEEAERILGRPLLTFAQWVKEHEADFS
jgi:uncharacterized protein YbjT (DUF2867 family)